jgi:membrane AbrB-like protein
MKRRRRVQVESEASQTRFGRFCAALEQRDWVRLGLTIAIGVLGGFAASAIRLPLAWMLGPFIFCAAVSLSGVPLRAVPHGREVGQVVVGLSVGMRFTGAVLVATLALLPAMFASTLFVITMTTLAAFILMPMARIDKPTAFFATAAAGMADMASIAENRGGSPSAVSVVHALRVSIVVLSVPLLVFAFGEHGTIVHVAATHRSDLLSVALVLVLGYCAARLFGLTHFPNPWLIGGVLFGGLLGVTELLVVSFPRVIIILSQIAIGISLGARFERELLLRLPRVAFGATVVTVLLIIATAGGAWVLSSLTDLPYAVSFLSVAPAAVTEMALTAQAMNVDAEIVTAFHVMRIALVEASILVVYAIFRKIAAA